MPRSHTHSRSTYVLIKRELLLSQGTQTKSTEIKKDVLPSFLLSERKTINLLSTCAPALPTSPYYTTQHRQSEFYKEITKWRGMHANGTRSRYRRHHVTLLSHARWRE